MFRELCSTHGITVTTVPERIRTLQFAHFEKCDQAYGKGVAEACNQAIARTVLSGVDPRITCDLHGRLRRLHGVASFV